MNKHAQALQKLSTKAQIEQLGEEGYRNMMKDKSRKALKAKKEMIKSGRLTLINGKYRRAVDK